jgi:protein phosphatase methylesterase 1
LTEENLINDSIEILEYVKQRWPDDTIVTVGHSMGGAIAAKATERVIKD